MNKVSKLLLPSNMIEGTFFTHSDLEIETKEASIFGLLLQMASTYTIIDFSFILVLSIGAIVAEAARRTHCNHLIRLIESACLGFESVWRN